MSNSSSNFSEDLQNLHSEDPYQRREIAEKYFDKELTDEVIEELCKLLLDSDNGVRDAVANTLIYCPSQSVAQFVVPYIASKQIATRNLAGEVLLKRGISSIPAMVEYIDKGNDDDKKFIIDVLGLIGDLSPEDKIIEVLKTNNDENVILACIEALGNIKSENSVAELTKAYDSSELYRPTVMEALGKIGSDDAVSFMIEKYHTEDELTKFSIIESFEFIGNEQAFFLLLSELKKLTGQLAWAAILSLKGLKDKLNLDIPFDESMKNSVLDTLVDADMNYKRAASYLIQAFNDNDILSACLKIYGKDQEIDENVKSKFFENPVMFYSKAAALLKNSVENSKAILDLMKELIENDGGESLGKISPLELRNLSDSFTTCLENTDEEVRRSSIELLFFLDPETGVLFLDTMLSDDNYWNRIRLVEILENFDDERITEAIKKLAQDPEEMVAERALMALNQKGITL